MLGLLYIKSLSPKVRRTTVMEFTKVVAERYSCKNFSTRKVEAEKLIMVLITVNLSQVMSSRCLMR